MVVDSHTNHQEQQTLRRSIAYSPISTTTYTALAEAEPTHGPLSYVVNRTIHCFTLLQYSTRVRTIFRGYRPYKQQTNKRFATYDRTVL